MQFISYNGANFADQGITIKGAEPLFQRTQQGIYVSGSQSMPSFAGVQWDSIQIPTFVTFKASEWSNIQSKLRALDRILRWDLTTQRTLVAQLDDGTQVEIPAVPRSLSENGWLRYELLWEVSSYWSSSSSATTTILGPASAGDSLTGDVTSSGTVRALPKVTLVPQKDKTSGVSAHSQTAIVTEQSGQDLTAVPHSITIDHAALVTASKSTSAGTDILVYVDGAQVDRRIIGANTSTCEIVYPLTVSANSQAVVQISYAPSGQTYTGNSYAQGYDIQLVTERSGNAQTAYPYMLEFDHASLVSASKSNSDGSDIRVWIDGLEYDRTIYNANNAATQVWLPLAVGASGTAVVVITTAASGFSYSGSGYTNGSLDLSASDNDTWVYTTPDTSLLDNTPGRIRPIVEQVDGTYSAPSNYGTDTGTASGNPYVETLVGSGSKQGNYVRFYAGGIGISSIRFALLHNNGSHARTQTKIIQSADLSSWTVKQAFTIVSVNTAIAYTTYSLSANQIAVALGQEKAAILTANGDGSFAQWGGTGTSELQLDLVTSTTPNAASFTAPVSVLEDEQFVYEFSGSLSDELGHTLTISNVSAPTTWARNTSTLVHADLSIWTATGASVTTGVADPAGGTNAVTLVEDGSTGQHKLTDSNRAVTANTPATLRITGHANGRSVLGLLVTDHPYTGGCYFQVDTSDGSIYTAAGTVDAAVFSNLNGRVETGGATGWWSLLLTFTPTVSAIDVELQLINGSDSYAGDGSSGIDLYDVQLIRGNGAAGGIVIDAATRTAWLIDRGGLEVANSAKGARRGISLDGNDTNWLALEPDDTTTLAWTEDGMDADGMLMTVEVADRWR